MSFPSQAYVGTQDQPSGLLPHGLALTVYAPVDGDRDSYPVLSFFTGFGGSMAVKAYSEMLKAVAARGVVVVGADHKMNMSPDYPQLAEDLRAALDWCARDGNLDALLANQTWPGNATKADLDNRLVVGAQSAGNHVTVQMLEHLGCGRAKGLFMLDPVDGYDPFGIIKSQNVIKGDAAVNFSIPALHVETGMDPKKKNFLFPACAPKVLSNDHFYDAFRSAPIWQVNATAFGHLDCTDTGGVTPLGLKLMCPGNPGGEAARAKYHALLAGAVGTFIEGLFSGAGFDAAAAVLEGRAGAMPVDTVLRHKLNGATPATLRGGCTHKKTPPGGGGKPAAGQAAGRGATAEVPIVADAGVAPVGRRAKGLGAESHVPCKSMRSYLPPKVGASYDMAKHNGTWYEVSFRDLYPWGPICDCQQSIKYVNKAKGYIDDYFVFSCGFNLFPYISPQRENITSGATGGRHANGIYDMYVRHSDFKFITKYEWNSEVVGFKDDGRDQYKWVIEYQCGTRDVATGATGLPPKLCGTHPASDGKCYFTGIQLYVRDLADVVEGQHEMVAYLKTLGPNTTESLGVAWVMDDFGPGTFPPWFKNVTEHYDPDTGKDRCPRPCAHGVFDAATGMWGCPSEHKGVPLRVASPLGNPWESFYTEPVPLVAA